MTKNSVNWNILIVGGVVLGGLYFWNKIKTSPDPNAAVNYVSGLTGETISSAQPRTIGTDLRQFGRTERALGRQSVDINRQDERTTQVLARQATNINRQDERTARVALRQSGAIASAKAVSGGGVVVTPTALSNPTTASTISTARSIIGTPSMGGGKISKVKITGTQTITSIKRPVFNLKPITNLFKR